MTGLFGIDSLGVPYSVNRLFVICVVSSLMALFYLIRIARETKECDPRDAHDTSVCPLHLHNSHVQTNKLRKPTEPNSLFIKDPMK